MEKERVDAVIYRDLQSEEVKKDQDASVQEAQVAFGILSINEKNSKEEQENLKQEEEYVPRRRHNLVETKWAYHVTQLKKGEESKRYQKLALSFADDYSYDGPLVGMHCVFFSTGLRKPRNWGDNEYLPTTTTYPRQGLQDEKFQRVKVPLTKFNDYHLWEVKGIKPPQNRLILARPEFDKYFDGLQSITRLDLGDNPYLVMEDNVWYTICYDDGPKLFVNFVVPEEFPLTEDCVWDDVTRSRFGAGEPVQHKLMVWRNTQEKQQKLEKLERDNETLQKKLEKLKRDNETLQKKLDKLEKENETHQKKL